MGQLINLGEESLGFALNKHTQLALESTTLTVPSTNTYVTILDVTGEGFLNKALVNYGLENTVVKITIDGVVVVWTENVISGLVQEEFLNNSTDTSKVWASARVTRFRLTNFAATDTIPIITMPVSTKTTGVVISTMPLFFKKTCKVEIMKESGSLTGISCSVQGGLKV